MTIGRQIPTDQVKEASEGEIIIFTGAHNDFKKDADVTTSTPSLSPSVWTSHNGSQIERGDQSMKQFHTGVQLQQEVIEKHDFNTAHSVILNSGCDSAKELQREYGTIGGCKQEWSHPATEGSKTEYKREEISHSLDDKSENLSTVTAASSHAAKHYTESVKNREATDPHQGAEVRQLSKRIKLETAIGKTDCTSK